MAGRRGFALFHTLALVALVLLVALAVATSTMSQLNLSARYAQRTQADNTARAAMSEFIIRVMQAPAPLDITAPAPPVLELFRGDPLLLSPRPPLEGMAVLRLERCVDNSGNASPVASWFDGGGKTSVPPYSVSVVYEVSLGSRKYLYESILQQRWPYALAATGPIQVTGRMGPEVSGGVGSDLPSGLWSAPSEVKGRILAMQTEVGLDGDPQPNETAGGQIRTPTLVSETTYNALYPYAQTGGVSDSVPGPGQGPPTMQMLIHRLVLGGPLTLYVLTTQMSGGENPVVTYSAIAYPITTVGAQILGSIDLLENLSSSAVIGTPASGPSVRIHSGNTHRGSLRREHRLGGLDPKSVAGRQQMRRLFAKPDTSQWQALNINPAPHDSIKVVGGQGTSEGDLYYAPGGKARVVLPPLGVFRPTKTDRLGGYFPPAIGPAPPPHPIFSGQAKGALMLENVALAVEGDMALEDYLLQGKNATLVVDGTLTLDGSYLDAGQNGMVIFCRRLVMRAQGEINGLIVAEKGAVLFGGLAREDVPSQPGLIIRGGLLIGGNDLRIMPPPSPSTDPPSTEANVRLPLNLTSFTMVSTRIEYNPKYLRSLNRCGPYEVLATELRN